MLWYIMSFLLTSCTAPPNKWRSTGTVSTLGDEHRLSSKFVTEVAPSLRPAAVRELGNADFLSVASESPLTRGTEFAISAKEANRSVFLVRAVKVQNAAGGFQVFEGHAGVRVVFSGMASRYARESKYPLLVALSKTPRSVLVQVCVDE